MTEQEMYHKYDELVSLTLTNLRALTPTTEGKIKLLNFNRKDIEHIYMLRIALIARDVFDLPVEIDAPWWDVLWVNWHIRKKFGKIKRVKWSDETGIPTQIVINHMRDGAKRDLGHDFNFADIYRVYYEGSIV
jgi:hypothetical protein